MSSAAEIVESEMGHGITWKEVLAGEREKDYFVSLLKFVESERTKGKHIYPKNSEIFNALTMTPFEDVKVVVLGQDPYHGPGQAHGLSFSVLPPTPPPPSLVNIFLELKSDLGISRPSHGSLESWSCQGVLLLNAVLTVEDGKPGSHANKGWEQFTDRVIQELNSRRSGLVFLLWGAYAQKKAAFVDRSRHCVLAAPHPSPLSAHRGFLGCRHFSRANEFLAQNSQKPIDWKIE
jgi:uracil-DNA glycosylase